MNPARSIRALLLGAGLLLSGALFVGTYVVVVQLHDRSVREEAEQNARAFADLTFNAMFELMSTGWTRMQLQAFVATVQRSADRHQRRIEIHRGEKVSARFGPIEQDPADATMQRAYATGLSQREEIGGVVRLVLPLVALPVCLGCHGNAASGDVLGLIDVSQDIGAEIEAQRKRFAWALAPMVPIGLACTLLMVGYIRQRINRSIDNLADGIAAVNKLADLRMLEARSTEADFEELHGVVSEVSHLTRRIRGIAVDKEMLEFEIRLLEKFILTSDVIKDWREYVCRLIVDIDSVMPAYVMFSLFKVSEDDFDLEVFWRYRPTPTSKQVFESTMRRVLASTGHFDSGYAVRVEHNVANSAAQGPELVEADLELQFKSLLVESPKIGGIVGIGMHTQPDTDPMRLLVVESILATLLNVVGSVKAIDRYTRDLEYYVTRDPLTNLYNQRVFWELTDNEVMRSARHGYAFSLLVVDADNFKSINDSYGHTVGDAYLQQIVRALRSSIRDDDLLSRYGGDEFVVLLPETGLEGAREVATRVVESVASTVLTAPGGTPINGSVSVGMATYPEHAITSKDLFLFADNMMYRAKAEGKNRVVVPQPNDVVEVFRTLGEKSMLILQAAEQRSVVPVFQPIVDVASGAVQAMEVLSRIRLEDGTHLIANDYVAIAEKMGVMHKLDLVQLEKTLAAVRECGYDGLLFINMSPRALVLNNFVQQARRMTAEYKVDPSRLVFEITERETIKNMAVLERFIASLRGEGFKLAIDDFGSGFSSYHYIRRFPIDFLKIEGEFILGMGSNEKDLAVVRSIVSLSQTLGIRTVAEFVESAAVLDLVAAQHIDLAQGFHIRHPQLSLAEAMRPAAGG